jgi:hypothetical protein
MAAVKRANKRIIDLYLESAAIIQGRGRTGGYSIYQG